MPASEWLLGASSHSLDWWQMAVRAVVVFAFGALLIRILGRKAFGRNSALDIVLSIIIGSILSRAVTGNAPLIPSMVASLVMVVLHFLLSLASTRWNGLDHLVKGRARLVVRDGAPIEGVLARSEISRDDLLEALRLHGRTETLDAVKAAYLERNGQISIIGKE